MMVLTDDHCYPLLLDRGHPANLPLERQGLRHAGRSQMQFQLSQTFQRPFRFFCSMQNYFFPATSLFVDSNSCNIL